MVIYKIVDAETWEKAESEGRFSGAGIDLSDGYIHFSTNDQVQQTADKHFSDQRNLVLVWVDADLLGDPLRWEASRGGDLFPHLYDQLFMNQVTGVTAIRQDKNGKHLLDTHAQD